MPTVVIVGAQWGDEGKGKVVDFLTEKADVVARYQGGHNAGHTVVIGGEKFVLHLVPSGIFRQGKLCIIGGGTVVDPYCLIEEIEGIKANGIDVSGRLLLSKGAHLIMPYHMAIEQANEGAKKIGTTGRGIGPAYVDKASRSGLRVGDLLYPALFRERLQTNLRHITALLKAVYGVAPEGLSPDEIYEGYMRCAGTLGQYIADTDIVVNEAIDAGKNVLFEGAQGALLDIDHGTYPYVTSSSASAGGACTGLGVGPTKIDRVLGVVKAYTTRVGGGPFPTELRGPLGETLRERGGEYGATTGRPRRCGWLDFVGLRHSVRVNGFTGLAITKLDILDGIEEIKVCTAYRYKGELMTEFPKEAAVLEAVEPVYETIEGWQEGTTGLKDFEALPPSARRYIRTIAEMLGVPVHLISTGADRGSLIMLDGQFG